MDKNEAWLRSKGYGHIFDNQRRNEEVIAPYIGKLTVKHGNMEMVLTGVNDLGVLYWSKKRQKKQYSLGYMLDDLPELVERGGAMVSEGRD